jgi:hypothetical protein
MRSVYMCHMRRRIHALQVAYEKCVPRLLPREVAEGLYIYTYMYIGSHTHTHTHTHSDICVVKQ